MNPDDMEQGVNQEIDRTKRRMKHGCLIWAVILLIVCFILLGYITGITFSFAVLYWLALLAVYFVIYYLPLITLPLAIFCLVRKKKIKRSVIAIAVFPILILLEPLRRVGIGISLSHLDEASIWVHLSNICYLYLFYYWCVVLFKKRAGKRL